jgi:hypothetical protein
LVTDITGEVVVAFLSDLEPTRGNSIPTRDHRLVSIRRLVADIGERVAGKHCDFPAPSEPDVRVAPHPAQVFMNAPRGTRPRMSTFSPGRLKP